MSIKEMIEELLIVNGISKEIPMDTQGQEMLLKALMTLSIPADLSDAYYEAEKNYLQAKLNKKNLVSTDEIEEKLLNNIYLFKGDITTIKADLIVNAANSKLLGCFIPGHTCIDNAIHLSAGLGLRNACNRLMVEQGYDEPVGQCKITSAYHLPTKYVAHTVGPNLNANPHMNEETLIQQLASSYKSILEAAAAYDDIKTLVFCSISTGVFGVPIGLASRVALATIKAYLETEDHTFNKIIINVFNEGDYDVYKESAKSLI